MKDIIKQTVNSVLEREGVKVTKIILFGSRARGDQTRKSDWDLLIVVDRNLSR
ncbi:MAG: nucleotidyltransferase domain-containing protein [Nitrososphaerota archaeon]